MGGPTLYRNIKAWRNRNRAKYRAQRRVNYAVKVGRLVRPSTCSRCGGGGRIDAHHRDYAYPLAVEWLCRNCHGQAHGLKWV